MDSKEKAEVVVQRFVQVKAHFDSDRKNHRDMVTIVAQQEWRWLF